MINDEHRLRFYERALEKAMVGCRPRCRVLEIGPGSGVLTMLAARAGASHVLAVEADPDVIALARANIARNQHEHFSAVNVTVVEGFSQDISIKHLPLGRRVDVLVSEILGNGFLDENVLDIVPDARDRLVKSNGIVIPSGGCQYMTLVEAPQFQSALYPISFEGLDLRPLRILSDPGRKYPSNTHVHALTERICVTEVDFLKDDGMLPSNKTVRVMATASGLVHAALLDFDLWADKQRANILSTSHTSNDSATSSWIPVLQNQHEFDDEWAIRSPLPKQLFVREGEWLELGVQYIKRDQEDARSPSIYLYVTSRRAAPSQAGKQGQTTLPRHAGRPAFARYAQAQVFDKDDVAEANTHDLLIASDMERMYFYKASLDEAAAELKSQGKHFPSVLDCSGGYGVAALHAIKSHSLQATVLAKSAGHRNMMLELARVNGVHDKLSAVTLHDHIPDKPYDIVVVEPPAREDVAASYLSPFAPPFSLGKRKVVRKSGRVVPPRCCLEVGLAQSSDLARLYSVPGGFAYGFDFTSLNAEARRQGALDRPFVADRAFGNSFIGNVTFSWLSSPQCVVELDLKQYMRGVLPAAQDFTHNISITRSGLAHALVARWAVFSKSGDDIIRLGPERTPLGRHLTWQEHVQPLADPNAMTDSFSPLSVHAGGSLSFRVRLGHVNDTWGNPRPDIQLVLMTEPRRGQRSEL